MVKTFSSNVNKSYYIHLYLQYGLQIVYQAYYSLVDTQYIHPFIYPPPPFIHPIFHPSSFLFFPPNPSLFYPIFFFSFHYFSKHILVLTIPLLSRRWPRSPLKPTKYDIYIWSWSWIDLLSIENCIFIERYFFYCSCIGNLLTEQLYISCLINQTELRGGGSECIFLIFEEVLTNFYCL